MDPDDDKAGPHWWAGLAEEGLRLLVLLLSLLSGGGPQC